MNGIEKLYEDLEKEPENWKLYNILADYYGESGDQQASDCVYWMVTNNKRPRNNGTNKCSWFNTESIASNLGDPESDIPKNLCDALEGDYIANHKNFNSLKSGIEALIKAWSKINATQS